VQARLLIPTAVSLAFGLLGGAVLLQVLMPAFASIHARARGRVRRLRAGGT
jgi:hypothetical protein